MTERPSVTVQVVGDPTADWMLVVPPDAAQSSLQLSYRWDRRATVGLGAQPGGAALLTHVVEQACTGRSGAATRATVCGVRLPPQALDNPHYPGVTRVFTLWTSFPRQAGSRDTAWRVREFLGQQPRRSSCSPAARTRP